MVRTGGSGKRLALVNVGDNVASTCDGVTPSAAHRECHKPNREKVPAPTGPRVATLQTSPVSTKTQYDAVDAHVLWRETDNRLNVLLARVREGVDVDAASEFARWLRFTPILSTLPVQEFPLKCSPVVLSAKVDALVEACGQWYSKHERSRHKPDPNIPKTELERINAQLAAVTVAVAQLTAAIAPKPNQEPILTIVNGKGQGRGA